MSEKRGVLRVIAAANFIFAILFLIFSLPFFWRQVRVLRNWPETDAQVLRSEVVSATPAGHENVYRAKLQVLYTVDGQPVTSELTSFESTNYEATREQTDQFPVGSHRAIRYDPANPAQARIGAGWNRTYFALPLIIAGDGSFFRVRGSRVAGHCEGGWPKWTLNQTGPLPPVLDQHEVAGGFVHLRIRAAIGRRGTRITRPSNWACLSPEKTLTYFLRVEIQEVDHWLVVRVVPEINARHQTEPTYPTRTAIKLRFAARQNRRCSPTKVDHGGQNTRAERRVTQ